MATVTKTGKIEIETETEIEKTGIERGAGVETVKERNAKGVGAEIEIGERKRGEVAAEKGRGKAEVHHQSGSVTDEGVVTAEVLTDTQGSQVQSLPQRKEMLEQCSACNCQPEFVQGTLKNSFLLLARCEMFV